MSPPPGDDRPILIAENDDNDFFFFEHRLRRAKVQNPIIRFPDGNAARAYLETLCHATPEERERKAKVLFLDIKMPGWNGFQVLEWARARPELASLRIIVLSGSSEPEDIARAEQLG